jgi:long-chain acyl-CoA synthetase
MAIAINETAAPVRHTEWERRLDGYVQRAQDAAVALRCLDQEAVDRIVWAMTVAGLEHAVDLAELAMEETHFGVLEDKVVKNYVAEFLYDYLKDKKSVGVIDEDRGRAIQYVAEPIGVVLALLPITNPTSTALFKSIVAAKTRNALNHAPVRPGRAMHDRAAELLQEAGEAAGLPLFALQVIPDPTLDVSQYLFHHPGVDFIWTTGGPNAVAAAKAAGKPCPSVGSGNAPVYLHASADIPMAVVDILISKTFDSSVICPAEQTCVIDEAIYDAVIDEFTRMGARVLSEAEATALAAKSFADDGGIEFEVVGQCAPRSPSWPALTRPTPINRSPTMNPVTTPPTTSIPSPAAPAPSGPQTLGQMALDAAQRYQGVALQFRRDGKTMSISYSAFGAIATEIAQGLIAIGIRAGDRVAILGATSADWTLADYGALCAGAVVAPIYHTNSPDECGYVIRHSEARLVFCENPAQAAKIAEVRPSCPQLEHVVLFDGAADGAVTLAELRKQGITVPAQAVHERLAATGVDDLATIVYTSGTTGPPKGCMLSHGNMLETTRAYVDGLGINETHSLYQFLPLAHVLARVAQAVVIRAGARACFWSGDSARIIDELSELQPTHFPAVPRIYEKIHGAVAGRIEDGSAPQRALFGWALARGAHARAKARHGQRLRLLDALQYQLADRLVLAKVRGVFGNGLQIGLVGAAPIASELLEFFDACGVLVLEGYGLTETCSAATLNTPTAVHFGTVGKPLPGTEVSVAADGELLIRGPSVFQGYYKDADATEAALTHNGWLHTGDLGEINGGGFVAITGRKKDLIITSSGKNITPVNIESALRETRYITEAVVFGDNRPYLVALLTLDRDETSKLAARLGIASDAATVARDPGVIAEVQQDVDAVNQKLARIEQVKRFAILDHDLSQVEGEMTPTLKVKRAFVYDKYADVFSGLYAEGATS